MRGNERQLDGLRKMVTCCRNDIYILVSEWRLLWFHSARSPLGSQLSPERSGRLQLD